jgi:thiamine pyrophosphate-dependent acetolactate synthase large subunit-like protein
MLQTCGIVYAACNPGASFRGLHDSIVNYGGNAMPELIQCCHEETCALAHGYAKATGTPMAALMHNIVGLQHAAAWPYSMPGPRSGARAGRDWSCGQHATPPVD